MSSAEADGTHASYEETETERLLTFERDAYRVEEVMTTELYTVAPDDDVMTALEQLDERAVGRLVVMDNGEFVGLVTRTDIMSALSIIKSGGRYQSEPAEDAEPDVFRPDESRQP